MFNSNLFLFALQVFRIDSKCNSNERKLFRNILYKANHLPFIPIFSDHLFNMLTARANYWLPAASLLYTTGS